MCQTKATYIQTTVCCYGPTCRVFLVLTAGWEVQAQSRIPEQREISAEFCLQQAVAASITLSKLVSRTIACLGYYWSEAKIFHFGAIILLQQKELLSRTC